MTTITDAHVLERFIPLVQEVTGAAAEQVTMDSCLTSDLGAESIDLLDLSFLIEETFGITIDADEFERKATARLDGEPYERAGVLTEAGLAALREALPEVPPQRLAAGLKTFEIPAVLTVAVFVHLIGGKLIEAEELCDA